MVYCKNCGAVLMEGARFCAFCGAPVQTNLTYIATPSDGNGQEADGVSGHADAAPAESSQEADGVSGHADAAPAENSQAAGNAAYPNAPVYGNVGQADENCRMVNMPYQSMPPYGQELPPYASGQPYGNELQSYAGGQLYGMGMQSYASGQPYGMGMQSYAGGQPYGNELQPYAGGQPYGNELQSYAGGQLYGMGMQSYASGQPYGNELPPYASGQPYGNELQSYAGGQPYGMGMQPYAGGQPYGSELPPYAGGQPYGNELQSYAGGQLYGMGMQPYAGGQPCGNNMSIYMAGEKCDGNPYTPYGSAMQPKSARKALMTAGMIAGCIAAVALIFLIVLLTRDRGHGTYRQAVGIFMDGFEEQNPGRMSEAFPERVREELRRRMLGALSYEYLSTGSDLYTEDEFWSEINEVLDWYCGENVTMLYTITGEEPIADYRLREYERDFLENFHYEVFMSSGYTVKMDVVYMGSEGEYDSRLSLRTAKIDGKWYVIDLN